MHFHIAGSDRTALSKNDTGVAKNSSLSLARYCSAEYKVSSASIHSLNLRPKSP